MATPTIQKGHAVLYGIGDSSSISTPAGILETAKGTHKFKMDAIEDENGSDAALVATNEYIEADFVIVPDGDVDFTLTPLATVTTSGFSASGLNGTWIYVGDAAIDLSHKTGKYSMKCRRYINNANLS